MLGVPVRAPVIVLKLIPGGVALMLKLAIAPPVELIVNPVADVFTVLLSVEEDNVKVGASKIAILLTLFVQVFAVKIFPDESRVIP